MPRARDRLHKALLGKGAPRAEFAPPPPANPVEVGLALRVKREQLGLSLDTVRDETGVPRVDLECLERGQLEPFHLEAAAIVALFRYAQVLGLDPDPLARIVREQWPRTATGIEALGVVGPGPVAHLRAAEESFGRLAEGRQAIKKSRPKLGITKSTRHDLKLRDLSANATIAALVSAHRSSVPQLDTPDERLDTPDEEPVELAEEQPPQTAALGAVVPGALSAPDDLAVEDADVEADDGDDSDEDSGRFGRIAQVVAERFGVEDEQAAEVTEAPPVTPREVRPEPPPAPPPPLPAPPPLLSLPPSPAPPPVQRRQAPPTTSAAQARSSRIFQPVLGLGVAVILGASLIVGAALNLSRMKTIAAVVVLIVVYLAALTAWRLRTLRSGRSSLEVTPSAVVGDEEDNVALGPLA